MNQSAKEYALSMQRLIAFSRKTKTHDAEGFKWSARWWYWDSKMSMIPHESIEAAKNQYALSRHMSENPKYYERKPAEQSHWQWFLTANNH